MLVLVGVDDDTHSTGGVNGTNDNSGGNTANGGKTGTVDDDAAKVAAKVVERAGIVFGTAGGVLGVDGAACDNTTMAAKRTLSAALHSGHDKYKKVESILSS